MCECDVEVYMDFGMFLEPNFSHVGSGVFTYNIVAIFIDIVTKGTYFHWSWDGWNKKST